MKAPPPIPEDCGSTRLSTICVAIAASAAAPPARSIARPAAAARGLAAATMCRGATTFSLLVKLVAGSGTVSAGAAAVATRISAAERDTSRYAGECAARGHLVIAMRGSQPTAFLYVMVVQAPGASNKERRASKRPPGDVIAEKPGGWHSRAMLRPGTRKLITGVDGIPAGKAAGHSPWDGVPGLLPTEPPRPAVDVRGPAPGTRPAARL